ncbi:MAG: Heme/copper-type cytochrome/quinol oxidase subunit 3-like protein [Chthoniobacter sp.]|jgi:cytochrome c oxidase subunit 3|nr:Heme/copper-type cytochrome/quinol oxidase subunit 3-like protein [Chthoniobacter sp.]
MQIPYEVTSRPDTGLWNAKLGIWLFLASEVMLFGGLFSGYLFLRLGAEDGYWPHGLLNVPIGTFNTAVLIASSVTIVLTWANLKMRNWVMAQRYLLTTILCGLLFLFIKLVFEYPEKFAHFGAYIKKESTAKYEAYLGNEHARSNGLSPRYEISGHLEAVEVTVAGDRAPLATFAEKNKLKLVEHPAGGEGHGANLIKVEGLDHKAGVSPAKMEKMARIPGVTIEKFELALDPGNADPSNPANDRPHFWHQHATDKIATIDAKDVSWASSFAPKHSSYFAIYFTITGLHGLHVLGGVIVMAYFYLYGGKLYRKNPEHQANRIEVVGLFWHFVDLVWIFVFPIFYLL